MAYRRLAEFMKRQGAIDAEAFEGFRLEVLELSRGYEPKPVNPEGLANGSANLGNMARH
jgi:hypothetical protein